MQKRLGNLVLTLCLALALLPATVLPARAAVTGTGTGDNPYMIGTWDELKAALRNSGDGIKKPEDESADNPTYFKLTKSVSIDDKAEPKADNSLEVSNGRYVVLDLAGFTIDRNLTALTTNGHVITVNGTLTVTDSSSGGTITGGSTNDYGGGVYVAGGGSLTMSSGTISGNTANFGGGGVYVASGGSFTMNGGTIGGSNRDSGNTTNNSGGGVYVAGSFIMSGSAVISYNSANGSITNDEYGGGGVYVKGGTFQMKGGSVSHNTASKNCGGGVYITGGTFTMSNNAMISYNSASSSSSSGGGGGVYIASGTGHEMSGGTIEKNHAVRCGGGVYISEGAGLTMKDGTIGGNTATNNGGGAYINSGTLSMIGGTIGGSNRDSGNTATNNGGGAYVAGGTFTMSGSAAISYNSAEGSGGSFGGGGVYVSGGTFQMQSGSVSHNTANHYGGGVCANDGTFEMHGGSIADNTAAAGGGVLVRSTFNMADGAISGNSSSGSGGGIYVLNGRFAMSGGTITGNNANPAATGFGGGVYINNSTFELAGAPSITGNFIGGTKASGSAVYTGGSAGNVYLRDSAQITLANALTYSSPIGVYVNGTANRDFTSGWGVKMPNATPSQFFVDERGTAEIQKNLSTNELCFGEPAAATYTVTVSSAENGSVTASTTSAAAGATVTLTVTPASGYELATLTVTDADSNNVTVGADNTFTMPASNVTVTASFQPDAPAVTPPASPPSGGDDSPSSSSPASATVTVPVSGDANTVNVAVSVSGTAATLRSADIKSALADNEETGTVEIDVGGLDRDISAITISAGTVSDIAAAVTSEDNATESLTVKLTDGAVTFDAAAVEAITEQAGGRDLHLNLDGVETSAMSETQRAATADLEVAGVLDVYMTSGGSRISDFKGGSAEIRLPFTAPGGRAAAEYRVWYVAENGALTDQRARYDTSDGCFVFTVTHFSNYVVAYSGVCPRDGTCPISAFTDADPAAWYHDGVHWAIENGVMDGWEDAATGKPVFVPGGSTSRAMVAVVLWRLEGEPAASAAAEFNDVEAGKWYSRAIGWAASAGVITGWDDPAGDGSVFAPDDAVTREQLAAMLYRYAKQKGADVSVGEDTNILSYDDAFDVAEYAVPAMQWACGEGIIGGLESDGGAMILAPRAAASRAVVATMLMRYCAEIRK